MRQNQQNKNRARGRGRRGPNPLTRTFESNGPDIKIRGSALHIAEKYTQLARDASSSGDRVMAENYLQHAEHYYRIIANAQMSLQAHANSGREEEMSEEEDDLEPIGADRFEPRQIELRVQNEESREQPAHLHRSERGEFDRGERRERDNRVPDSMPIDRHERLEGRARHERRPRFDRANFERREMRDGREARSLDSRQGGEPAPMPLNAPQPQIPYAASLTPSSPEQPVMPLRIDKVQEEGGSPAQETEGRPQRRRRLIRPRRREENVAPSLSLETPGSE